jgi:exonuclease III
MVVGDFNAPLSPIDRTSRQNINKDILELNSTIDQMDLTDVYRIFHLTTAQYTFFSATHGTFSKIDHIIGYKAILTKYKEIEITPCIMSDHSAMNLALKNNKPNTYNLPCNPAISLLGYTQKNMGQVTTEAPAHPYLLQHYS